MSATVDTYQAWILKARNKIDDLNKQIRNWNNSLAKLRRDEENARLRKLGLAFNSVLKDLDPETAKAVLNQHKELFKQSFKALQERTENLAKNEALKKELQEKHTNSEVNSDALKMPVSNGAQSNAR
jgi:chromosome segregation ATPase